jgi:hypothetical protein
MDPYSEHLIESIRKDFRQAYIKQFLETVTGPEMYGVGKFEVYLEDGEWEIRPAEGWKQPDLRGILNVEKEQK